MSALAERARHQFTIDEYHRMVETGILIEDDRVELIDGEIVKMAPIGPKHAEVTRRLTKLFSELLSGQASVSVQNPITLSKYHEPQPDIALLAPRSYADAHPGPEDVFLVVEVADTSAGLDRKVKLMAYAASGVPEVWLILLAEQKLEVYRGPTSGRYLDKIDINGDDAVSPGRFPEITLSATQILP